MTETLSEMRNKYTISVSPGNKKMGSIPSISLPPQLSCIHSLKCYTDKCYALRMVRFRPNINKAWFVNYNLYVTNPYVYKELLKDKIRTLTNNLTKKYFRWHVGGDILNTEYWNMMCSIAREMDDVNFMAFTKKYHLSNLFKQKPDNLNILVSLWPNENSTIQTVVSRRWKELRDIRNAKIAWLEDDPRIKSEAFNPYYCYGSCINCKQCWTDMRDIILHRH